MSGITKSATTAAIIPYTNIGTAVTFKILPSALSIPNTEHTAIILLIHTILPIAPPTDCKASIRGTESPVVLATEYCTAPKVRFDTVLEPEKKDPTAPKYDENIVQ